MSEFRKRLDFSGKHRGIFISGLTPRRTRPLLRGRWWPHLYNPPISNPKRLRHYCAPVATTSSPV